MSLLDPGVRPRLRDRPAFRSFWAANAVSSLGTAATVALLPTLLATAYDARGLVPVLTTAQALPGLLLAIPAGVLADRLSRRRLMLAADLFNCTALSGAVALAAVHALPAAGIVVLGVLLACGALTFEVAAAGMLPSLLPRHELPWANARMTRNTYTGRIAAPPVAGALLTVLPGPLVLLADAVSYLASAYLLRRSSTADTPRVRAPGPPESWRAALHEGARVVLGDRRLRVLLACAVLGSLALGVQIPLFYVLLGSDLQLSPFTIGVLLGVNGAASLATTYAVPRVIRVIGIARSMVSGSLLVAAGMTVLALLPAASGPATAYATVAEIVMGLGAPTYVIAQSSLRQAVVADHLQGRVAAFRRFAMNGAAPAGGALSMIFVGGVTATRTGLLLAGALMAASALAAWAYLSGRSLIN